MTEVCPVITPSTEPGSSVSGSIEAGTLVSGKEEEAYTVWDVDPNFCNPESSLVIIYNGLAIFDGTFLFGGAIP